MSTKIDRSDLIDAIDSLADELGEAPTRTDMNERGEYSSQPYYNEFDGWNDALRAAGYDPNHRNEVPDDELLIDLHDVADTVGRPPTFEDCKEYGEFHPTAIAERFGTFLDAREAAGFTGEERKYGKRIEKPDLLDDLRRLGDILGRAPTQGEVNERGRFAAQTYHRRFGSFLEALEAAGYDLDDPDREWPADYPTDWIGRRREVRRRDGYLCVDCEMSNTEHQNHYSEELHVHHVASEGDPHDTDNLVTLCANCHPKWDRLAADPRDS